MVCREILVAQRSRGEKNMKVKKEPIDSARLRVLPRDGFSWIDRRFVRDGFIELLPSEAILLYFFLVAVSDAQGLSFYADPTVGKLLKVSPEELSQARARLIAADLILYRYPIYQVLRLPPKRPPLVRLLCTKSPPRGGEASIGEILGKALKELHD